MARPRSTSTDVSAARTCSGRVTVTGRAGTVNLRGRPRRAGASGAAVLDDTGISKRLIDNEQFFNENKESLMKTLRNVAGGAGTVGELLSFLWRRKRFWLIPFVVMLLLVGVLILVGEITGVAPFIYTLF